MFDFYNNFFFGCGNSKKSMARKGELTKKWAGLNIFYMLLDLVRGRFVYDIPETMDDRFLELCMLYSGRAGIIDYQGEIINLDVMTGNNWSRYGYLNNCTLVDFMGKSYGQFIPNTPGNVLPDCAIIYNNTYDVVPISRIRWYADRLATIQGSINSCIVNMRGSLIFNCSKEQQKVIEKAFRDMDSGAPIILSFESYEGAYQQKPEVITNPITGDILKSLMETYDKTMAEFLTEFGINANGIINKLSGISDTELKQNEQRTEIAFNQAYNSRVEGLQRASEMFGVEMSVKPNFHVLTDLAKDDRIDVEEVESNVEAE